MRGSSRVEAAAVGSGEMGTSFVDSPSRTRRATTFGFVDEEEWKAIAIGGHHFIFPPSGSIGGVGVLTPSIELIRFAFYFSFNVWHSIATKRGVRHCPNQRREFQALYYFPRAHPTKAAPL
jgi:hypothetical protein